MPTDDPEPGHGVSVAYAARRPLLDQQCGVTLWTAPPVGTPRRFATAARRDRYTFMSALHEVAVGLAAPAGVELLVKPAREALVVADHVAEPDVEAAHQPRRQRQRRRHLARVAQHLRVGHADVLDADRGPVEPDRVPAHHAERHELVDRPVGVDHEVRAGAGELVQLRVGDVGVEGRERRGERARDGDVLDDHLRIPELPRREGVVALRVRLHLGLALGREGDRLRDDVGAGGCSCSRRARSARRGGRGRRERAARCGRRRSSAAER